MSREHLAKGRVGRSQRKRAAHTDLRGRGSHAAVVLALRARSDLELDEPTSRSPDLLTATDDPGRTRDVSFLQGLC